MGCDIHWYSETRRDGKWECDQKLTFVETDDEDGPDMNSFPGRARDYWLFGLLNPSVSTEWDWSFPESSMVPEDVSREISLIYDRWDVDAHSAGSLTRAELKAKLEELKLLIAKALVVPHEDSQGMSHHKKCLMKILSNMTSDVPDEDQRIVFWFDN